MDLSLWLNKNLQTFINLFLPIEKILELIYLEGNVSNKNRFAELFSPLTLDDLEIYI